MQKKATPQNQNHKYSRNGQFLGPSQTQQNQEIPGVSPLVLRSKNKASNQFYLPTQPTQQISGNIGSQYLRGIDLQLRQPSVQLQASGGNTSSRRRPQQVVRKGNSVV